mgnify:CR=1 FL=1
MTYVVRFPTVIWSENKKEFVNSSNKASNKYIQQARNTPEAKEWIKKNKDFGRSYHSVSLLHDNNFLDLRNYVGEKALEIMNESGYDMSLYKLLFTEMWVQEFSKKGGGHHNAHVHWNQHVSGFYFLKASDKTSHPVFHDPRTGARATTLHMRKNLEGVWAGHDTFYVKVQPGDLILFPGYVQHEFSVDHGKEPFRFIHFNLQAVPDSVVKNEL